MALQAYIKFPYHITVILITLITATGCANLGSSESEPITQEAFQQLQQKIKRLERIVKEKDAIILKQQKRQQQQIQAQQDTSHEAARTRLKLHQLATKPSTASTIAEVEVAFNRLTQAPSSSANKNLQIQAQRLINKATRLYNRDEYAASMNHAAQAYEIINMAADKNRHISTSEHRIVTFQVPVMLQTKTGVNLRKESRKNSTLLFTFEKGAALTANAYQGNWLRIQTDDSTQGWVLNTLVEIPMNGTH